MHFSTGALAVWCVNVGVVSAFSKAAFAPSRAFVGSSRSIEAAGVSHVAGCFCSICVSRSTAHAVSCACPACSSNVHSASCSCSACSGRFATRLFAETAEAEAESETVAEVEDVPSEVEALDGIESAEEAHNAERPARQQLKKKKASKGKPVSEFEVGTMVQGLVRSITSYGAFVDIGAQTDGLLHISQLSKGYVADVKEILKEGQEIEVRIVTIDSEKNQVALSLMTEEEAEAGAEAARSQRQMRQQKQRKSSRDDAAVIKSLSDKGWDSAAFVEGTVVSTVDFGCFVRVDASQLNSSCEGEMDGLVHISALTSGRVSSVTDVVNVDDKVQVRVKGIDGRKVSLSMLSVEDEASKAEATGNSGGSYNEGAKDWKESLQKMQATMPTFTNFPVVEDRRK